MKSDEKYIETRFGKKAPFTVPEGYLANLAKSIMADVGAEPHVQVEPRRDGLWPLCRRYVAAAACVAAVAGGLSVWMEGAHGGTDSATVAEKHARQAGAQPAGSVSDEEINYTMLDNDDMYTLMASN